MSITTVQKKSHEVEVYGQLYRVGEKSLIWPDEWDGPSRLQGSDWDQADFYLPSSRYEGVVMAVNVVVTGRTFQRRPFSDIYWVRVRIEFVKDGDEPDEVCSGWWHPESAW